MYLPIEILPNACEMLRTLKPEGRAIITTWKHFAAAELIHAAQEMVQVDSEPMKVPNAEFMEEGYLLNMVVDAGFKEVKEHEVSVLCKDHEIEGIRGFILGDFTRVVREKWTHEEKAKWPHAVDRAIQAHVARHTGVRFEAWVVTGVK